MMIMIKSKKKNQSHGAQVLQFCYKHMLVNEVSAWDHLVSCLRKTTDSPELCDR